MKVYISGKQARRMNTDECERILRKSEDNEKMAEELLFYPFTASARRIEETGADYRRRNRESRKAHVGQKQPRIIQQAGKL